jgi:hypothetical protein
MLVVLDEFTRRCLVIVVARRLRSDDVLHCLTDLFTQYGPPEHIRSDNGPEFVAISVGDWLGKVVVKTLYIEPGSPWENGYRESLNSKLRDELLNGEIFTTLREAQVLIETWRRHYNAVRPHSSLGYRPPAREAILPRCRSRPDSSLETGVVMRGRPAVLHQNLGSHLDNPVVWNSKVLGGILCTTREPYKQPFLPRRHLRFQRCLKRTAGQEERSRRYIDIQILTPAMLYNLGNTGCLHEPIVGNDPDECVSNVANLDSLMTLDTWHLFRLYGKDNVAFMKHAVVFEIMQESGRSSTRVAGKKYCCSRNADRGLGIQPSYQPFQVRFALSCSPGQRATSPHPGINDHANDPTSAQREPATLGDFQ